MSGEEQALYGGPGAIPGTPLLFYGLVEGALLVVSSYLTNSAFPVDQPARFPLSGPRIVQCLRVHVVENLLLGPAVVAVALDGADTALALTIAAGATGDFSNLVDTVDFPDGAGLDIHVTPPAGSLGLSLTLSASVLC